MYLTKEAKLATLGQVAMLPKVSLHRPTYWRWRKKLALRSHITFRQTTSTNCISLGARMACKQGTLKPS